MKLMPRWVRGAGALVKETTATFWQEKTWRMAAAISFYVLFTAGPLLVLELHLAELIIGQEEMLDRILAAVESAAGEDAAAAVENFLDNFSLPKSGWLSYLIGLWMLFFGGVNAVGQLRQSIEHIWDVDDSDKRGKSGLFSLLREVAAVFIGGLLIFASVMLSAFVYHLLSTLDADIPGGAVLLSLSENLVSLFLLTLIFAAIFRYLPSTAPGWKSILSGALLTSLLFAVGRFGLILWISGSNLNSIYGSINFMVIFLIWIYFSAEILLYGATFAGALEKRLTQDEKGITNGSG